MPRLLCLLCLLLLPSLARAGEAERARAVRWTAASLGAVTGVGITLAEITDEGFFAPGASKGARIATASTGFTVQTAASTFATWWFADRCLKRRKGPWRSIGWGVLYGSAAGAMSFGTGLGTTLAVGWATGAVEMRGLQAWYQAIPLGYWSGTVLGGVACIPVGAVLAPTISLTMRF
jgi:hypothetical protein